MSSTPPRPDTPAVAPAPQKKRHVWLWVIGAVVVIGAIGSALAGSDSNEPATTSSEPATTAYDHMAGTPTELQLCRDLRAGASDATVDADALAVVNDTSTGPDDLSVEALAYDNSFNGIGVKTIEWERNKLLSFCG